MRFLTFKQFLMEMPLPYRRQPDEHEKIWYHASDKEYEGAEIRPMSHFGSKNAARARAATFVYRPKSKHINANIMAYRLKLKNGWEISDEGTDHTVSSIVYLLHHHGHITDEEHKDLKKKVSRGKTQLRNKRLADFLKTKGVDHLYYKNSIEDKGSKSVILVNPKESIRPIFQNKRGRVNYARAERSLGD